MTAIKKSIDEISAMAEQRLPVPGVDVAWLVNRVRELEEALRDVIAVNDQYVEDAKPFGTDPITEACNDARAVLLAKADQEDRSGMSNHTYEIRRYSPSSLSFYFGEAGYVGSLFVEERSLHFEGDVDKSAQTFFAGVRKLLEQEGEQEKRDREIRNKALEEAAGKVEKLAERYPDDTPVESQLSNAVFAIRALKEPS